MDDLPVSTPFVKEVEVTYSVTLVVFDFDTEYSIELQPIFQRLATNNAIHAPLTLTA